MDSEHGWLSPSQAALKLNLTPNRVRQLLDQGRIGCRRTALGRFARLDDVERMAEKRGRRAASGRRP